MYIVTFGKTNELVLIKEVSAIGSDEFHNDKKLKHHTSLIAKSVECPVVHGIFGTFTNPFCHLRFDLN